MLIRNLVNDAIENIDSFVFLYDIDEGSVFQYRKTKNTLISVVVKAVSARKFNSIVLASNMYFSFCRAYVDSNGILAKDEFNAIEETFSRLLEDLDNGESYEVIDSEQLFCKKEDYIEFHKPKPEPKPPKRKTKKQMIEEKNRRIMDAIIKERIFHKTNLKKIARANQTTVQNVKKLIKTSEYAAKMRLEIAHYLGTNRKIQNLFKEFCWRSKNKYLENPELYKGPIDVLGEMIQKRTMLSPASAKGIAKKVAELSIPTNRKYKDLLDPENNLEKE